jgi:hypothetical protein
VRHALEILRKELEIVQMLSGAKDVSGLGPHLLRGIPSYAAADPPLSSRPPTPETGERVRLVEAARSAT